MSQMTKINLTVEQIDLNRRKKVLLVYLQNEFAILNQIHSTHCEKNFISIQDIFLVSMMYKISYDVHDLQ